MKKWYYIFIVLFALLIILGCTDKYPQQEQTVAADLGDDTCVGCHLNKELLEALADPIEEGPEDSGEG